MRGGRSRHLPFTYSALVIAENLAVPLGKTAIPIPVNGATVPQRERSLSGEGGADVGELSKTTNSPSSGFPLGLPKASAAGEGGVGANLKYLSHFTVMTSQQNIFQLFPGSMSL
jgi:hypothetical protein